VQDRIRRATADDQPVITRLVRHARLNPRGLDWHGFVIAEAGAVPVGVAQVRQHSDGSRELASLVVLPEYRGRSVAGRMVDTLLADETGPVFTIIDRPYVQHFTRWDFRPVGDEGLPRSMARQLRIGQIVTSIGSLLSHRRIRLQPLRRPPRQPSD
jgi:amino-acid N-acetyltransferase